MSYAQRTRGWECHRLRLCRSTIVDPGARAHAPLPLRRPTAYNSDCPALT